MPALSSALAGALEAIGLNEGDLPQARGISTDNLSYRVTAPLKGLNDKPRVEIQQEKAWHRTAAWLFAKGFTAKEIAEAVGKTAATVSLLCQQPFFRQQVAEIIAEFQMLDEGALNVLRNAQASAATTLVTLASSAASEAVRASAANSILDRVLGKPVQHIQRTSTPVPVDPSGEKAMLEKEIGRLQSNTVRIDTVNILNTQ